MKSIIRFLQGGMVAAGVFGLVLGARAAETLQIKGSDTMVHLASAWAEKFMQSNPGIEVSVTGGGSGTGISALLNGTTDICNASRPMKDSEINSAKSRGFTPVEQVVGLDGIAVIVNPSNPVKVLTLPQLKQIFSGEAGNWKRFGGPDQKIVVFTRDSSSGTFAFFQEHVLNKGDYSVKARRLASNSAIVQSVSEDAGAIGYVGLGYVAEAQGKVKALAVKKTEDSQAVLPSMATVKDQSYPISRGLLMYTKGDPAGNAQKYLQFVMSPEGQAIVEEMGFVRLK